MTSQINTDAAYVPPWEKDHIAQVPYMDSASPELSNAEREALPSLWATRTTTLTTSRPRLETSSQHSRSTSHFRVDSPDESWRMRTPLTAPPPLPPAPYETPIYIPPGPKSAPSPPSFVKASSTPPDSLSQASRSTSASIISGHHPRPIITALPGTMSTRTAPKSPSSRIRTEGAGREIRKRKTRRGRWIAALKDLFSSDPVDETQFERIEDKHWTDD